MNFLRRCNALVYVGDGDIFDFLVKLGHPFFQKGMQFLVVWAFRPAWGRHLVKAGILFQSL